MDVGPVNSTKQMPQEYGDHWISDFLQALPISQATVRHSGPTNPQVKGCDQTRKALVKIINRSPAEVMRILAGNINLFHLISILKNEQENRYSTASGGKVMLINPITENPSDSLLAISAEKARIISTEDDSDAQFPTTSDPKEYSIRHDSLPVVDRNPGSDDDCENETKGSDSQEGRLPLDTTRFHLLDTAKAISDPKLHAIGFENCSDTETSNDIGATEVDDCSIISAAKAVLINQYTSNTIEATPPKSSNHESDQSKTNRDNSRKRVRSEALGKTVIIIDSNTEDEMEVMPALLANVQPNSPRGSVNITHKEAEDGRKQHKRPRLTKEYMASLPVTARPNSSEDSGKASDNEPKGRRKSKTRRVTTREFRGHINAEATWLNIATVRCNALRKLLAEQRQHIATFDALNAEHCQILAEMSVDRLPRSTRLQLSRELGDLEERRSKETAELRQATNFASSEVAAMKQDLEQWYIKEEKVTERIERCR